MAFDLVIGKSALVRDKPVIFGSIHHDDYISIVRLDKEHPNWFLNRMSNIFDDQHFESEELTQAAAILDELILKTRGGKDSQVLHKLSAAVSMALRRGHPLLGVAD
jgi:hypothetical protein